MTRLNIWQIIIGLAVAVAAFVLIGCQSETPLDPDKQVIMQKTEDLFTRIKVRDYSVFWENEFPYKREEDPLDNYLKNAYMVWYQPDTLMAVEIDSATIWADTAYSYMKVEWLLSDSTFLVDTIRLRFYKCNDEWIKPQLSILDKQLEFEEELRVYWEAVREMQAEEEESDSDSADN